MEQYTKIGNDELTQLSYYSNMNGAYTSQTHVETFPPCRNADMTETIISVEAEGTHPRYPLLLVVTVVVITVLSFSLGTSIQLSLQGNRTLNPLAVPIGGKN